MEKNTWEIETIRLTIFTPDPPSQQNIGWWKEVASSDPENVGNKAAHGIFTASGLVSDLTLNLNVSPGRVDWLLVGAPSDDSPLSSIGDIGAAMKKFHDLLQPWIDKIPVKVTRLALGAGGRLPAKDKVDAYKRLSSFLPQLNIDPVGSSELQYQINRPRSSRSMPQLTINRLSKWNVVTFATTAISSGGPTVRTPLAVFDVVETDMNTALENEVNLAPSASELIRELEGLTRETLEKGDVA